MKFINFPEWDYVRRLSAFQKKEEEKQNEEAGRG